MSIQQFPRIFSRNLQQVVVDRYVYLLLHVNCNGAKKIPNLHEQNNSLLTATKTTDAEQENITSIYSIIAYYTSVENRQWGDVRSIMISCDKMHPISRLNVCVDGRGIFWLHTELTYWLPVKIDLDFSTAEIIFRKYIYYWDTLLRNQVQKTKKIETRNHLWLNGFVVLKREKNKLEIIGKYLDEWTTLVLVFEYPSCVISIKDHNLFLNP